MINQEKLLRYLALKTIEPRSEEFVERTGITQHEEEIAQAYIAGCLSEILSGKYEKVIDFYDNKAPEVSEAISGAYNRIYEMVDEKDGVVNG
jgi:hypothetical protein